MALRPLVLILCMSMLIAHELSDTPYMIWNKQIAHQFNRFRTNVDELLEFHAFEEDMRSMGEFQVCFDDLSLLIEAEESGIEYECKKVGMWKEDARTAWGVFANDVNFLTNEAKSSLNELKWSHELSLSAGFYAEELSGCSIYQPTVLTDIPPSYFLRQLADYDQLHRVVIYPERFQWEDPAELIWDLFMDDTDSSNLNLVAYLNPEYDSIGVACNCHPAFGQFCVI